ncbi:hypothetical protein TWF694_005720 [Orbilia ellipsospora]|uniref:Uncharacterized protein n=1 Tax=Orbilia ellipsospora TaxID=2528407 RepID=A0AAV9WTC7_9PEZI
MDATQKVGIIAPKFSDTVHWYNNIRSVQDVIKIVLDNNSFLTRSQLAIRVHDSIANFNEEITPGDIVQVFQKPFNDDLNVDNTHGIDNSTGGSDSTKILTSAFSRIVLSSPDTTSSPTSNSDSKPSTQCSCKILNAPTMPRAMAQYPDLYRPSYRSSYRSSKLAHRVAPRFSEMDSHPSVGLRKLNHAILRKRQRKLRRATLLTPFKHNKILLRFHNVEFGEHPIEVFATRHEPLLVHYNIVKQKLLRMGCLAKNDELDFQWPHLRWTPRVSDKVADIVVEQQRGYGCFVRKRRPAAIQVDSDDEAALEEEAGEDLVGSWDMGRDEFNAQRPQTRLPRDEMMNDTEEEEGRLEPYDFDGNDRHNEVNNDGNSSDYTNDDDELKVYTEPNLLDDDQIDFNVDVLGENDACSQASSYLSPSTRYWLDDRNFDPPDGTKGNTPSPSSAYEDGMHRLMAPGKEYQDIPNLDPRDLDVVNIEGGGM